MTQEQLFALTRQMMDVWPKLTEHSTPITNPTGFSVVVHDVGVATFITATETGPDASLTRRIPMGALMLTVNNDDNDNSEVCESDSVPSTTGVSSTPIGTGNKAGRPTVDGQTRPKPSSD